MREKNVTDCLKVKVLPFDFFNINRSRERAAKNIPFSSLAIHEDCEQSFKQKRTYWSQKGKDKKEGIRYNGQ